jgi:Stress responsive A/B Barrel Domain
MSRSIFPFVLLVALVIPCASSSASAAEPKLSHVVFFTLKDHSPAAREKFVASCSKYLKDHEGAVSFAVSVIADDVKEPVSDQDFDVALNITFKNKGANATYQKSERHQKFVAENRASFAKVRVFDSYVSE